MGDNKMDENDGEELFVDRLLRHRLCGEGRREFLVLWQGLPPEEATWEAEENILDGTRTPPPPPAPPHALHPRARGRTRLGRRRAPPNKMNASPLSFIILPPFASRSRTRAESLIAACTADRGLCSLAPHA